MSELTINRIVPNSYSDDLPASKAFYQDFLGMKPVMDMGWIITFAVDGKPDLQISILQNDSNEPPENTAVFLSIEVSDVDLLHEKAVKAGIEITYPLTHEEWGVRRFFVKDPNGATINLLQHIPFP